MDERTGAYLRMLQQMSSMQDKKDPNDSKAEQKRNLEDTSATDSLKKKMRTEEPKFASVKRDYDHSLHWNFNLKGLTDEDISRLLKELTPDVKALHVGGTQLEGPTLFNPKAKTTLTSNSIEDEGATTLTNMLKGNSSLTSIHLSLNKIKDKGATTLADMLKTNSTLTRIDLGSNEIGDEGATAIFNVLDTNSTLRDISLGLNKLTEKGATAIANVLKTNSTLTDIYLNGNQIKDEGAVAMADMLKKNSTLTSVSLGDNLIEIDGAFPFASVLKKNSTLTYLDLADNEIGDGDDLYDALAHNSTLQELLINDELIPFRFRDMGLDEVRSAVNSEDEY